MSYGGVLTCGKAGEDGGRGREVDVRTECKKRTSTRSRGMTGSQGCVAAGSVSHGGGLKCGQAGEDEGRGWWMSGQSVTLT